MDKRCFSEGRLGGQRNTYRIHYKYKFLYYTIITIFLFFSLKVFMSTFLLYYFSTICLFAEDAIVMFHFSCKGSTSKASYRHFSSTFSQNPLFCKIFTIYLRHVPKGA